MKIENLLTFLKLAVLKVVPISELLNPNRYDGTTSFGSRQQLSSVIIVLEWLPRNLDKFLNRIEDWLRDSLL